MPPRDPSDWMWTRALDMLERAERLQRQFFQVGEAVGPRTTWQPPVDMFETERTLWIMAALPGVRPDSVRLQVQSGTLILSGERPLPPELRRAAVHRLEIPHGRFERRLELPAGHYQLGDYDLDGGCLVLRLRKLDR